MEIDRVARIMIRKILRGIRVYSFRISESYGRKIDNQEEIIRKICKSLKIVREV